MNKPKFHQGDEVSHRTDHMNEKHTVIDVYVRLPLKDGNTNDYVYNLTAFGCSAGCFALEDDLTKVERKAS